MLKEKVYKYDNHTSMMEVTKIWKSNSQLWEKEDRQSYQNL